MSQGFYEMLGVEPDAGAERIRAAYQRRLAELVRRLRAARKAGADVSILDAQERELREAMEVLSEPARRRRYDAYRASMNANQPPTDAESLWTQARMALVEPVVPLSVAFLRAITELPLGDPLPIGPGEGRATSPGVVPPPPISVPAPSLAPPPLLSASIPAIPEAPRPTGETLARVVPPPPPGTIGVAPVPHVSAHSLPWSEGSVRLLSPELPSEADSPMVPVEEELESWESDWGLEDMADLEAEATPEPPPQGLRLVGRPPPPEANPPKDEIERISRRHGLGGRFLREVRQMREMTLEDLVRATRISSRYLTAIEEDDFDRLPAATFVRGYIKQVASVLQVEERGIVEGFMEQFRSARGG